MENPLRTIVMAEDHSETVLLLKQALKKQPIRSRIHFLPNGVSLLRYLAGDQEFNDRSFYALPDLIILDLKMPFFDALATLPSLKSDPVTSRIPVFIFTDESNPSRVKAAYKAGASAYFVKPTDVHALRDVVALMAEMDFTKFAGSRFFRTPEEPA